MKEIVVAGRSNAGKSTFVNAVTGKKEARVSSRPGKTRWMYTYDVGKHYRLVDIPGYGFAAQSGEEVVSWGPLVENYLTTSENLVGLLLLADIRRDWSQDEQRLIQFMQHLSIPTAVVFTKADRLNRAELLKRKQQLLNQLAQLGVNSESTFFVSLTASPKANDAHHSVKTIEEFLFNSWVKETA